MRQEPGNARPFVFDPDTDPPFTDRGLARLYLADEAECVRELIGRLDLDPDARTRIGEHAADLVRQVREQYSDKSGVDALMQEYDLSSQEGVVLMCLAEALLRIPDADTADRLIKDKLAAGDWAAHRGESGSFFVNASTWGLILTGKFVLLDSETEKNPAQAVRRMVTRLGEPLVRTAIRQAMRILAFQFVMGRDIEEALTRSREQENRAYLFSYDMLGEAALTAADAARYFEAYTRAIEAVGEHATTVQGIFDAPSISVKLSALHPRYALAQRARILEELVPRVRELAEKAKAHGIGLTIDAEESERLDVSLDVIEAVYRAPSLEGWEGFGLALQAYQKRAIAVVDWITALVREQGRRMPVRLVKGAYWDSEIKRAQELGLDGYPVFTRRAATNVSYLACARRMLDAKDEIYPQFATHNAHTIAAIMELSQGREDIEFQRLHGMGYEVYDPIIEDGLGTRCRVYAPVGTHRELLPYLVRRLLENGANSSFVNRIFDEDVPVEEMVADPLTELEQVESFPHPRIPLPRDMFGAERKNSRSINLNDPVELERLAGEMQQAMRGEHTAAPVVSGKRVERGEPRLVRNPALNAEIVGHAFDADEDAIEVALAAAASACRGWDATPAAERAAILERAADLYEEHMPEFMALCSREAGKSLADGISEVREAVDFMRYYAQRTRAEFAGPVRLPGPTGESNELSLHGRGVFFCISPWNFPLAIFTGQVAAALAAGNAVLAKPAEQTTLVAALGVELIHRAGVPGEVLHFVPGDGARVGGRVVPDARIQGVCFTGSTEVARLLNRQLAARDGPIPVLIAETGGQNAMLVDSSALPEQVVLDVVASAFNSAGQRCSALRVLCLQEEVAPRVLELLAGYMDELKVGEPGLLSTDVGPVIDEEALKVLQGHAAQITETGRVVRQLAAPTGVDGSFFGPLAVEIDSIDMLEREVFGPILHIVCYKSSQVDTLLEAIRDTGYGLTLGVHSRIDATYRHVFSHSSVGNTYVNRNIIGAVVGVQPFGGHGLSGTGPKAGGPHYLHRFAIERTLTVNTAAVGGNATLLSLSD